MADQTGTSVFDMDKLTVTQEQRSPFTLSKVPGIRQGAGQAAQIANQAFLLGCPGVDAKLVNGDRWQTITGNMHEETQGDWYGKVVGSRKQEILRDDTHWVIGNLTQMVIGNVCILIVGSHVESHVGAYVISFVAPMTENHAATKSVNEPFEFKVEGGEFSLKGWEVGIVPTIGIEVTGVKLGVTGLKGETEVLKLTSEALCARMHIGAAKIVALDTKLGALLAKAQPAVNAAPGGTIISPVS